jgi:hypothetical protein
VLRLRGLPFLATSLDVREFFSDFELSDVYICRRNGEWFEPVYLCNLCLAAYDAANRPLNKHVGSLKSDGPLGVLRFAQQQAALRNVHPHCTRWPDAALP